MSTASIHAQRIGAVLGGRYHLRRVLGAGGMGAVYEAEDPKGDTFAIKVLLGMMGGRDATARFARETRLMATLSHPNLTRVVDSGVDATLGAPYLVMELLSGEDVESLLRRCGPLSPALAVRIVLRACAGIEAAHAAGIIHRDVKPANLFLHDEQDGGVTLKVCDFGIARELFAGDTISRSGETIGSPIYMSPEQARDAKRVDGRTDVWSLAMTLYELLTGKTAFDQATTLSELMIMLSTRDVPSLQHKAPWVSEALTVVTHGALIRDADDRCPNVGALIGALRPLAEGSEQIDRRLFTRLSSTLESKKAPRAELPRSWRDVEERVQIDLPSVERQSTMVQLLGRTVGRYRLLGVLGRGGMGTVYETIGPAGERLALKVIQGEGGAPKPDAVGRFLREARAMIAISSPNVVRVVDADTDPRQELPFIVMELLEGQDLAALLRSAGALEAGPVARLFVQACRGLAAAHAHGIVHRDIKPANIFLHELEAGEIVAKICDFGVAKQVFASDTDVTAVDLTQTGGVVGSPMYFSPEQARNAKNVDHRTDIWSLAVSLYQALAGRRPWDGASSVGELILAVCTQDVPPLQDVAPWVGPELAAVVHRGLRREAGERYASMEAFAAALEPFTTDAVVRRTGLAPVSPEKRTNVTARMPAPPISSKAAYANTLGADRTTGATQSRSSRGPVALGMVTVVVLAGGLVFGRPLLRRVRHDPSTTAAVVEAPGAPASAVVVATAVAAPDLPPTPTPVSAGASASTIASASPSVKVAPARSGRRPPRPPPAVSAGAPPRPPDEFLHNQGGTE
jgi:serine/threonine protein kinase